ncbi:MAG: hypothetical protein IKP62_00480 [Salinivirgaceae bacterium]|nr:hypothetical protein [Salinivirgaceae bacterium]
MVFLLPPKVICSTPKQSVRLLIVAVPLKFNVPAPEMFGVPKNVRFLLSAMFKVAPLSISTSPLTVILLLAVTLPDIFKPPLIVIGKSSLKFVPSIVKVEPDTTFISLVFIVATPEPKLVIVALPPTCIELSVAVSFLPDAISNSPPSNVKLLIVVL